MVNPGDRFNLEKAIAFATEAIKAAMYLNGRGAVALMTLIGAVGKGSAGGVQIKVDLASWAIFLFGLGTFAAASSFVAGYLAQVEYSEHDKAAAENGGGGRRWGVGEKYRYAAIALLFLSLSLFVGGVGIGAWSVAPLRRRRETPFHVSCEGLGDRAARGTAPPATRSPRAGSGTASALSRG